MSSAFSTQLVMKVLDCLTVRANVTAQNIANAGTPNYRPLRATFESALAAAADLGASAVSSVEPRIEDAANASGPDLRLDMEVATASETAMRYSALIEILNRRVQLDALPLTGSR